MANIPRIFSPPVPGVPAGRAPRMPAAANRTAKASSDPSYLAKLMTMFPAEAVTFYTLGAKTSIHPLLVAFVVLLALVAVRWAAFRSSTTHKSNSLAVLVSAISFILWVFASADIRLLQTFSAQAVHADVDTCQRNAAFLIAVWTWVIPNFVKLDS